MTDFIAQIRERRVLPAVGVYAAGCWVLVEIVDRLVERYLLSPYFTDIVFWGLYSLIPAAILVAWTHGRPGKDKTTRLEKVGVSINLIATAGLLVTVFGAKDLGATASMVEVANEEGQIESRLVPSDDYRRRMAVFFFNNTSGDPQFDWLQYGVTELLVQDLQQNPFISATSPWWATGHYERMRQAGFDDALDVPRSLLREITADANRQYFVEGDISRDGGAFVLETRIWDSRDLASVAVINDRDEDVYSLVDRVSREIRDRLEVPKAERMAVDLPLAETYGESEEVFRSYIQGLNARLLDNDATAADAAFEQALQADPDFVLGWFYKGLNLFESGNMPGAQAAFARANALDYRLPDRDRLTIKLINYRLAGDIDKAIALARMQARLNGDAHSQALLASYLVVDGQLEEGKQAMELALEKDPLNLGLYLELANLERATGNADAAIDYAERYLTERPDDEDAMLMLGDMLREEGQLEQAADYYQRAQLVASSPVVPTLRLADLALRDGDEPGARALLEQAEAAAKTPLLAMQVRGSAFQLEYRLGRLQDSIEQIYAQHEFAQQVLPPFSVAIMLYSQLAGIYLELHDFDLARQAVTDGKAAVQAPMDQFFSLSEALLFAMQGKQAEAQQALELGRQVIEQFGVDALRFQVDFTRSELLARAGQLDEAAAMRKAAVENVRNSILGSELTVQLPAFYGELAALQVDANLLEEAEHSIRQGQVLDPNHPVLWLQKARLQAAKGQAALATASVQYALAVWKSADPEYPRFQEAQELLLSLSG